MTRAKLFLWSGGALFLGPLADTKPHYHHAAQICLGLKGAPFRLQLDHADWQEAAFAFLPTNTVHRFDSQNTPCAIFLVDGEGPFGQCRKSPLIGNQPPALPPVETIEQAKEITQNIATHLGVDHPHPKDWRIEKALAHIEALETKSIPVQQIADVAGLSESHFQHLFTQQVGIPFRRYLLWRRLNDSVSELLGGTDLTAAAHMGGFSDSAHFSRTFKQTFGLSPSELFKNSRNVQVIVAS